MLIAYGFVIAAVIMDVTSGKISNRLILTGLVVGLVRRLLQEGSAGLLTGVIQISLPVIVLYLFFLWGALGAGDIKLFSLIGSFVTLSELKICIIAAFILGAVWSLFRMIKKGSKHTIPFSVVILGGLIAASLC